MGPAHNMTNDEVRNNILMLLRSVDRPGIEQLVDWLEKSDFFTAPASTRYHLAEEGGLARHSLNVYYRLFTLVHNEHESFGMTDEEFQTAQSSIVLCALLHDVCKVDFYKPSTRNVKNEKTGQWEKVPTYVVENKLPMGHGEKSLYIIQAFIKLTRAEAIAIRWHMGAYDDAVKGGSRDMDQAFENYPLSTMLHVADMLASRLDEPAS